MSERAESGRSAVRRGGDSARTRRGFLGALGGAAAVTVLAPGRASAGTTRTVSMGDNYFDPVGLLIEPGTTVRFEIESGSHSATAYEDRIPDGATPFDSGTISEGAFEHTFEVPGTYDYYCLPHQSMGMTGRIVVGEPGGPAAASPIPDGTVPESDEIVSRGTVAGDQSGSSHPGGMMSGGQHGGFGLHALVPAGVLTTAAALAGGALYWHSNSSERASEDRAIATLRERYASNEIDEVEFERRLERLK